MIAGLEDISSGDIRIGDRVVNHLPPRDRDIAMVFQNYALYQHMSVYDNLAFGLRNKKTSEAEIKAAIDRAAGMLGLHDLMQRKPKQLSGGQQQRVALGRCIVRNPQVFLFDEPLSNLDAKLRAQMRIEIKRLHAAIPTTSVFVTHDQVEAMTLGDRVVIMRDGRIQQVGTPLQVYGKPANKFVAGFIGAPAMNFVDVTVRTEAGKTAVEAAGLKLTITAANARALESYSGRPVIMGVRPEHLALGEGAPGLNFDARVDVVEQLGSEILLETRVGDHSITVARVPAETPIASGDQVRVSAQPGRLHFFDPETELPIATT
jgi:multiple sugar transport system ATP-binding protein